MGLITVPLLAKRIDTTVGMRDTEDDAIIKRLVTAYGVQTR